jgi:hypothetical protein
MHKMHLLAARWHWPHRLNFRQHKKRLWSSISSLILHLEYFIKNQIVNCFTCYNFVLIQFSIKSIFLVIFAKNRWKTWKNCEFSIANNLKSIGFFEKLCKWFFA